MNQEGNAISNWGIYPKAWSISITGLLTVEKSEDGHRAILPSREHRLRALSNIPRICIPFLEAKRFAHYDQESEPVRCEQSHQGIRPTLAGISFKRCEVTYFDTNKQSKAWFMGKIGGARNHLAYPVLIITRKKKKYIYFSTSYIEQTRP